MKKLYLDCSMGAAGDMLMAALLGLHNDPDGFVARLNNIGIPHIKAELNEVTKCGIKGNGISVYVDGCEEGEHHHHRHHHTGIGDIHDIISGLDVSDKVKTDAAAVYDLLAKAESAAHGRPVDEIHFHEVGTMDAVTDITGVCMLIEELAPDRIISSPVHVGYGRVKCAHGILPVPAPATAYILKNIPTYGGAVEGELCTPTGAALLAYFTDEFTRENSMTVCKIGYGMGKRSFYDNNGTEILSAVRAMTGDTADAGDEIIILSCNIDDITGEALGFATERILDGGALDVFTTPIFMKKNRPAYLLTVICRKQDSADMARLIFKHTTTIGIRELSAHRYILGRAEETVKTEYGAIRMKKSSGYGVVRTKAEYDDLKEIAINNDIAISEIK